MVFPNFEVLWGSEITAFFALRWPCFVYFIKCSNWVELIGCRIDFIGLFNWFDSFLESGLPLSRRERRVRFSSDPIGRRRLDQKPHSRWNRSEVFPGGQRLKKRWLLCKNRFLFGEIPPPNKKYILRALSGSAVRILFWTSKSCYNSFDLSKRVDFYYVSHGENRASFLKD